MEKILVTEPEYFKAKHIFDSTTHFKCIPAPADEKELAKAVVNNKVRFVIVGIEPYRESLYYALPKQGVIARFGVGHDNIDKIKLGIRNLICTNTPGVLDTSVAELTVGLILSASRQITHQHAYTKSGNWQPAQGLELKGKTIAIIGSGSIALKVSGILKNGFGMSTHFVARTEPKKLSLKLDPSVDRVFDSFENAVSQADFVSIHIPALPENLHFVNKKRLNSLSSQAWLINTSRGSVIDEAALYQALKNKMIKGAALDVYENEPYTPIKPQSNLQELDNIIMLPHVGSNTSQACERMASTALKNLQHAKQKLFSKMDIINPEILNTKLYVL